MKKERYESPELRFQDLFLFEGVADKCWGFHHAEMTIFFDADHDDYHDADEPILFQHNFVPSEGGQGEGCNNIHVAIEKAMDSIKQAFIDSGYGRYWTEDIRDAILSEENAGLSSSIYIPVHS